MKNQPQHEMWSNWWVFVLAAAGSAVGLGNIWKFPYMAGENGGGAFVLVYLLCIAMIGIPVMMSEVLLGQIGQQNPIHTLLSLSRKYGRSPLWSCIGWIGVLAGIIILSYYAVIAGWVMHYMFLMSTGHFTEAGSSFVSTVFSDFTGDPYKVLLWFTLFMLITVVIVSRGVHRGLELFIRWAMPLLFILMFVLLVYAAVSGNFAQAVSFLFSFNVNNLSSQGVLSAMGHAFFTLSIGMGVMMAYGSYLPKKVSVIPVVCIIAVLDTLVALMAGLAIFPIVFANDLSVGVGPGLLFQTIPLAFGNLPAGAWFGTAFFLLVSVAAITSAISLLEPGLAFFVEKYKLRRGLVALSLGGFCWFLGIGTVFSFNIWSEFHVMGSLTVFDFLDYTAQKVLMPLGGFLVTIYMAYKLPSQLVVEKLGIQKKYIYLWKGLVGVAAPLSIIIIFLHSFGLF